MPKKTSSDLRERLLETAQQLLIEKGYQRFSLREVARKTNVSATSVYTYFEGKDHLIHTLMGMAIDDLNDWLISECQQVDHPVEQIKQYARAYIDYAQAHPREYQIIFLVNSDEMSRYPKEKFRRARKGFEFLTNAIEQGVAQGLLIDDTPRTSAYTIWAQLHGVMAVVLSKRLDNRINQQQFIEQAITNIIHGFQVRTITEPTTIQPAR